MMEESEQLERFRGFINSKKWIFAKTYSHFAPHEYIIVRFHDPDRKIFEEFVMFIRENGYKAKFGKRWFTYYNLDGYKYWTIGEPLSNTWVLNREPLKEKDRWLERRIKRGEKMS